ncbi:MAG: diguanylate cyclase [Ghiorsea sp.]|nr:diguanylate cyclase [Ghiorsea sp.]
MKKNIILIVDEMAFVQKAIKKRILKELTFEVVVASSKAEACMMAERLHQDIFVSIISLELSDDPEQNIVDDFAQLNIPQIIFSGKFDLELRQKLLQKPIIDYIPQEGSSSLHYLLALLHRLLANQSLSALIIDDSKAAQRFFSNMLEKMMIPCHTIGDPIQALDLLYKDPDQFSLLLIDYAMPEMNGVELILELQKHMDISNKAIIGISGENNHALTAHFLKAGANDFLYKSSSYEEFICRISQSLNRIEQVAKLTRVASTDFLTGLRNRRALFDVGNMFWQLTQRENSQNLCVCMLDIDYFKKINDTYGHDTGDLVLQHIAEILNDSFRKTDLIARYGGEEFCIVLQKSNEALALQLMNTLRNSIAAHTFFIEETPIQVTVSIGICSELSTSLESMINIADQRLYLAKERGRNRVVVG